jgi:NodT family efflux transporter outer membrane factor (OMF) lipoprotein
VNSRFQLSKIWLPAAVILAVALGGCMVGPKYARPAAVVPPAFKEGPPDSYKEGTVGPAGAAGPAGAPGNDNGWKAAQPLDQALRGPWWEIFGDPRLNALEEQLTSANQDLKAAEARYQQARALIRFNRASEFPTISAGPSVGAERESSNQPFRIAQFPPSGNFVLPFDVSWEADVWGRIRRTVTAAREEAQATAADRENAALSLHAELAFDYFELRMADAQKRLLDDTVKAYTDALQLTTNRFEGGASPKSDVSQARTQLDTTRVADTDIGVQRAQFEHAIAVLVGQPPAEFSLAAEQLDIQVPVIPVGLPSQLLERRPDIAAVERRMAEANEQIGIARAAYYPTLTLSASVGLQGSSLLNWLTWPSRLWAVGPSLSQTLFDAGRRRATSDTTLAAYDADVAGYRQTILTAFQQVEDNLAALRILEQEAQQQKEAVADARESLELFTNRYTGGVDTYLQVITAQTTALSNERNAVDILRRRMDASVLLIKALGGGWNASSLPKLEGKSAT